MVNCSYYNKVRLSLIWTTGQPRPGNQAFATLIGETMGVDHIFRGPSVPLSLKKKTNKVLIRCNQVFTLLLRVY